VGNADGERQQQDELLVHKSFQVNEYHVKAKVTPKPKLHSSETKKQSPNTGARANNTLHT